MACVDRNSKKETPKDENQKQLKDTSATLGASVYKANCVVCHGPEGKLSVSGSKALAKSTLNLEQRIGIITNGSRTMLPHRFLGDEKIKAVAQYIEKFQE